MPSSDQPRKLIRDALKGIDGMDKALREFSRNLDTVNYALLALDIEVPNLQSVIEGLRLQRAQMDPPITQIENQLERWLETI